MKTSIVSSHIHAIFIETQYKSIKKFFKGDYEFIVINDSRCRRTKRKINEKCIELGIKMISVPQKIHRHRTLTFPNTQEPNVMNACTRCADTVQYAYNKFKNENGIFFLIDSDMFLIKDFDANKYIEDYHVSGLKQSRGKIYYLWNGIFLMNLNTAPSKDSLNWDCGKVEGESVDVGGQTYHYLENNKDNLKVKYMDQVYLGKIEEYENYKKTKNSLSEIDISILDDFVNLYKDFKFNNVKISKEYFNKELLIDNCVFHIRGGGNWNNEGLNHYNESVKIIDKHI